LNSFSEDDLLDFNYVVDEGPFQIGSFSFENFVTLGLFYFIIDPLAAGLLTDPGSC